MTLRRWLTLALLACLLPIASQRAWAQPSFDFDRNPGNLPKSVVPTHYALWLDLDPARSTFSGQVDIAIEVRQSVAAIVLHARDLSPTRSVLVHGDKAQGEHILLPGPGPISQSWALRTLDGADIPPGRYQLKIAYTGDVNRSAVGLFAAGETHRMLATQFEAIAARNVFPSFDEPAFRAVFQISVRAPPGLKVFSNMPKSAMLADGDAVLHHFAPTPAMPSYLVAVSVGRFETLSGSAAGVPLRILTAPGKKAQADYAMRVTQQVLPFYTAYFGLPFALPKLDQQAVPSVRDGAMEARAGLLPAAAGRFTDPARAVQLIQDQQRLAGDDGALPARRVAAQIALLAAVRQREAAPLQNLLAR